MSRYNHILLLILLVFTVGLTQARSAEVLSRADSLYHAGSYSEAIGLYQQVLKQPGADAGVYYNLGNAYYRTQQYPMALVCYERFIKAYPGDTDAQLNLRLTRSKLSIKEQPRSDFFFVTWWNDFRESHSVTRLLLYAGIILLCCLLCFAGYLFLRRLLWRKICFSLSVVLFIVTLLLNVFAIQRSYLAANTQYVVVMHDGVLQDNPVNNAKSLHKIHAGEKALVVETYQNTWLKIEMPDNHTGWIKSADCEVI